VFYNGRPASSAFYITGSLQYYHVILSCKFHTFLFVDKMQWRRCCNQHRTAETAGIRPTTSSQICTVTLPPNDSRRAIVFGHPSL